MIFDETNIADGHFMGLISKKKPRRGPDTRNQEYYQRIGAHAEIFRNSPLITMQGLLNEDKEKIQSFKLVVTYSLAVYP